MDVSDSKRLKELGTENARLKWLLAEAMLENEVTKEALRIYLKLRHSGEIVNLKDVDRLYTEAGAAGEEAQTQEDSPQRQTSIRAPNFCQSGVV